MSSRLRSLDSKISFFAFADIITAVSGVLIFVALLLATDLGRPAASSSQSASSAIEKQLQETLARQLEVDAQNENLETLLATAETSPDPAKLQADIASLRAQLAVEERKESVVTDQLSASQAALAARDRALGLTDLNATVTTLFEQVAALSREDATARQKMDSMEHLVAHAESQLLKLHQRQNQIWLIPEKSLTTKEPVLVTVAGTGLTIDRFDRPDLRQNLGGANVDAAFTAYLRHAKTNDQYIVFLIRPSGISTFREVVQTARDLGFEVGYDALEENRIVHFGTPPPLDETTPVEPVATGTPGNHNVAGGSGHGGSAGAGGFGGHGNGGGGNGTAGNRPGGQGGSTETGPGGSGGSATGTGGGGNSLTNSGNPGNPSGSSQGTPGATAGQTNNPHSHPTGTNGNPPPPAKSWWQRLLEWLGFKYQ